MPPLFERYRGRRSSDRRTVVYRVGNVIIEDHNPPKGFSPIPPETTPPKVFTRDPILSDLWKSDNDRYQRQNLPNNAVPIGRNIVSLLSICYGKHVLIVQLRRMRAIGPSLYNLLHSSGIHKLAFNHGENFWTLDPIGVKINSGHEFKAMLAKFVEKNAKQNSSFDHRAMEKGSFEEINPIVQNLTVPQFAKVLAGIDISDQDLYSRDWNNPLLCER